MRHHTRHIDRPRHGPAYVQKAADAWSTAVQVYGVANTLYQAGKTAAPYVAQAARAVAPYVAAAAVA